MEEGIKTTFENKFGPGGRIRTAKAPGRSNLIGEHTDYNDGLVLPIAVDRHTVVYFRAVAKSPRLAIFSDVFDSSDEFPLKNIKPTKDPELHWANYVRGTAWALAKRGVRLKGGELYITGNLPRGAGLSSSASLEVATGLALLTLAGQTMDRQQLALACQEAEHKFPGVMCGIMDQTVVARAKAGHALQLDCSNLAVRQIPIALKGYSFAVFDTGVRHKLAGSEYNKRRTECEHAAKVMRRKSLRSVTLDDLVKYGNKLTSNEHKRTRHVLSENLRVAQFSAALARGDLGALGLLLQESHVSLARDFEVSSKELDVLVVQLLKMGASDGACPGARMTGGGFGGSVVALLKTDAYPAYEKAMRKYAKGGSLLLVPASAASVDA